MYKKKITLNNGKVATFIGMSDFSNPQYKVATDSGKTAYLCGFVDVNEDILYAYSHFDDYQEPIARCKQEYQSSEPLKSDTVN